MHSLFGMHTRNIAIRCSEFLGKCIYSVKEFFQSINIIKGKPRRPNEQGRVERGNADLKKALLKWEQEYPYEKWPLVGMYVVNKNISTRPTQNKANRSANEVYYGKVANATTGYILSSKLLNLVTTSARSDGGGKIKRS